MTSNNKTQSNNPGQEQDPRVIGLFGGTKQKWLRENHEEVWLYFAARGEKATRERFAISKDSTWANFLHPKKVNAAKLTKIERLEIQLEIAKQDVRSSRREVRELKEAYSQFIPFLANEITEKFFLPLLQGKIEIPEGLLPERVPAEPVPVANFQPGLAESKQTNIHRMLCADGTDTYNANHESSNALTKAPTSARANRRGSRKASADRDNPKSKRR